MASPSYRIIFLNRFFYPDHAATSELLSDLAFELARRGFQIKVIASRLGYDNPAKPLPAHEVINGVEVFRVWTSRQGRHRLHGRILDYASFTSQQHGNCGASRAGAMSSFPKPTRRSYR